MNFRAPEGTHDVLPEESPRWRRLEEAARSCFERFGYEEVRPPVFEYTQLFYKSSGETTDIVEKEMFTFGDPEDKGGTYSLRPELTPGAIRAFIEGGLPAKKGVWKLWYFGPAFRKERPQKGRYRQFTQLGVEAVGSSDPLVDAETMILFSEILKAVGVEAWELRVNSIGCPECRGTYREVLKGAIRPMLGALCENCRNRFERNVFRILDCKVDAEKTRNLPPAIEHTCEKCRAHMAAVEGALRDASVPYRVDPRIVRGLDYYTRTVYEFSSSALGAQNALCGGGRYDTLVRDMGGPDVGAVGFAAGAERILLAMKGAAAAAPLDFFGVAVQEAQRGHVFRLVTDLRRAGLSGDMDYEGRSVKAQMRSANRSGARYAVLVGPDEAAQGRLTLKDMKAGTERAVTPDEAREILKGGKS
jgi:histidyl-tRNA synthetase